jgi:PleD family two-component response regulator
VAKPRLLIVEDDPDIGEMLQIYFGSHGYEASVAEDGETAIKFCRANLPNLVLLDINLPDMDGYAVCHQLRQSPRTRHLPIIFGTQRNRKEDKIKGLAAGADDFVAKPFDLEELFLRVQNTISRAARNDLTDPRSGLPSTELSRQEIARAEVDPSLAITRFKLANLGPYQDIFGALALNEVMRSVGLLLAELLDDLGRHDDFLGQLGDESFVIISPTANKPEIIKQAKTRFRLAIPSFYSFGEAQGDGSILTLTASGTQHSLPMLGLKEIE